MTYVEAELVDRFVVLERYVRWACSAVGARPPLVARYTARDGERARYAPTSRMLLLGPRAERDDVRHELQHHLDELVGAKAGGEPRGVHGPFFYERLARLCDLLDDAEATANFSGG